MQTEIEAKFTNIDKEKIRNKLRELQAELIQPERLMSRAVFDFPDKRLQQNNGWVRVRDEGDKITMSYKQVNDRSITGTKEVNLEIDNFNNAVSFLESIGMVKKSYQETKRESWMFGGTNIEIDTWPWIPSFVEIEGSTEIDVKDVADKLGLNLSKALHGSVENAYQEVYDVTEEQVNSEPEITFAIDTNWPKKK